MKVAITRDAWISGVGKERRGNNGASSRWKLKGIQEFVLFDADFSAIKGRRITGALLHMRSASPEAPARRVSVSTVGTPWEEGTGTRYDENRGEVSFESPANGLAGWTRDVDSTVLDVILGRGNSIWAFANATPPDEKGWQSVAIEPAVVAANAAGLCHGFAVMDDVGTEWGVVDGVYKELLNRNRYFYSRHQYGSEPWLEVWVDGTESTAPGKVRDVTSSTANLRPGQSVMRFNLPEGGDILGFRLALVNGDIQNRLPQYIAPFVADSSDSAAFLLHATWVPPGQRGQIAIRPVGYTGMEGEDVVVTFETAAEIPPFLPAKLGAGAAAYSFHNQASAEPARLPTVGGVHVAVLDALDKVEALTGDMTPAQPRSYQIANHLWSAALKQVRLQAARNETIAFQIHLEGQSSDISLDFSFPTEPRLATSLHRFDYVTSRTGSMPDALVPLPAQPMAIPNPADPQAGDQRASFLAELHVPHELPAGDHSGTLTITVDGERLDVGVALRVWNFTLPNKLSFIPEMNCYGGSTVPHERLAYYRLAHEHRTVLNRLYYSWACKVADGAAPELNADGILDWTRFDREFGPLFDGAAFTDLPRSGEPVDFFYLPFNESWPMPIREHYSANYWADEAFSAEYREGYQRVIAQFAEHFNARGWHQTAFEFFLNNKQFFRRNNKNPNIVAPWILDEPVHTQDFWALRWFGLLFHQAAAPARGDAKLWFRADISRSAYGRGMLDGVMDREVLGGGNSQIYRMRRDAEALRPASYFTEYSTANDPSDSNMQPLLWSYKSWSNGSIGVLPWQVIGKKDSWEKADPTSLFYPVAGGALPSIRLKAFTRGQQDIEYLEMLLAAGVASRDALIAGLRGAVDLEGRVSKKYAEDAGTWIAGAARPQTLWELRTRVAVTLDALAPEYRRVVRDLPTPAPHPASARGIGYVTVAPEVPSTGPTLPQGL